MRAVAVLLMLVLVVAWHSSRDDSTDDGDGGLSSVRDESGVDTSYDTGEVPQWQRDVQEGAWRDLELERQFDDCVDWGFLPEACDAAVYGG